MLVKNKEGGISILKVIQNIHKQKISERAPERSTDFNESILSSVEEAVVVLDNKLQIIQSNNAFNNIFGNNIPGESMLDFIEIIKPYDINHHLPDSVQSVIKKQEKFFKRSDNN